MKIKSLRARPILDSRGQWTVEAMIELANGARAVASVPQGKSTGSAEAVALPAAEAVRKIDNVIAPKVAGRRQGAGINFKNQEAFDNFLIQLDGTPTKKKLGANAILAVSIAFARVSATAKDVPLWRYIRENFGMRAASSGGAADGVGRLGTHSKVPHPRLFINVVNGGLHAGNDLDFQEYLIIPKCRTFRESIDVGTRVYHELGVALVRAKGRGASNLGDEGGFAPNFKDDLEPFRILHAVVKKMKLEKMVEFGMDAAATDIKNLKADQLADIYTKLARERGFIYLEDPFAENAFAAFALFTEKFAGSAVTPGVSGRGIAPAPLWVAGDDLTTTNVNRMELAHAERSVNAVIIKPNQIGSVTEALAAVRAARRYGWAVIASHRSGETNDDFIADFAYGVGADGLKLGAPARGERVAKYNRLLEIEKES
jgi:enolase